LSFGIYFNIMAKGTKEIQRRIKSVNNTKKITRAMEMVSAAKMKKEVDKVLSIRSYSQSAWNVLMNLSKSLERAKHGLLEVREVKNILVVVVTSNRGLCGSYNSQLLKKVIEQVKNPESIKINRIKDKKIVSKVPSEELKFDFVAVGKKGFDYLNRRKHNVIALYDSYNYNPDLDSVRSLAKMVMDSYKEKKYDKVVVAYTDYVNTIKQVPKLRQLLPVSSVDVEKQIEEIEVQRPGVEGGRIEEPITDRWKGIHYKIEPEPKKVVDYIMPRLVEMQLYHAILESNASKESSRMMAMKNASEAANDMMEELRYSYNQLRQMGITQEIAEITSGNISMSD
jgi:F-type H+-transporting ATPase subunit gamma